MKNENMNETRKPDLRQGYVIASLVLLLFASQNIANIVSIDNTIVNALIRWVARATVDFKIIITSLVVVAVITFLFARNQSECNDGNDKKLFHGFWFKLLFFLAKDIHNSGQSLLNG
jgi:hypothetical protein